MPYTSKKSSLLNIIKWLRLFTHFWGTQPHIMHICLVCRNNHWMKSNEYGTKISILILTLGQNICQFYENFFLVPCQIVNCIKLIVLFENELWLNEHNIWRIFVYSAFNSIRFTISETKMKGPIGPMNGLIWHIDIPSE